MKDLLINAIPSIVAAFMIQLVMHEIGHLIGGLITGWRFIYLQVFHIAIVRENNRLIMKRTDTKSCQCIMYPKDLNSGAILYSLGGCIMNALITAISAIVMILNHNNLLVWVYTPSILVIGIIFLVMNGVPSTKRICNDMACCLLLKGDKHTRICHNAQLMIARELMKGKSYGQIPTELICLSQKDADNDILAYHAILEYYHYLDMGEYESMSEVLSKIEITTKVSQGIQDIIYLELLYVDLLTRLKKNDRTMPNSNRYDGDIGMYIHKHSVDGDVHSIRIKSAYKIFCYYSKEDITSADQCSSDSMCDINKTKVLYPGEKYFGMKQMYMIKSAMGNS